LLDFGVDGRQILKFTVKNVNKIINITVQ